MSNHILLLEVHFLKDEAEREAIAPPLTKNYRLLKEGERLPP